jgi:murein lipoprotein
MMMKKRLWAISMIMVMGTGLLGCATSRELEKVQAQEKVNGAKADQAWQDAQAAKAAADAATAKAEAAAARADAAVKAAENQQRIAEEKAQRADAAFRQSMRK